MFIGWRLLLEKRQRHGDAVLLCNPFDITYFKDIFYEIVKTHNVKKTNKAYYMIPIIFQECNRTEITKIYIAEKQLRV